MYREGKRATVIDGAGSCRIGKFPFRGRLRQVECEVLQHQGLCIREKSIATQPYQLHGEYDLVYSTGEDVQDALQPGSVLDTLDIYIRVRQQGSIL